MNFEKQLLKFIHDVNQIKSPYTTTISDLAVWFEKNESEIELILKEFTQKRICTSKFEENTGKVTIRPLQKKGIKLIQ